MEKRKIIFFMDIIEQTVTCNLLTLQFSIKVQYLIALLRDKLVAAVG